MLRRTEGGSSELAAVQQSPLICGGHVPRPTVDANHGQSQTSWVLCVPLSVLPYEKVHLQRRHRESVAMVTDTQAGRASTSLYTSYVNVVSLSDNRAENQEGC